MDDDLHAEIQELRATVEELQQRLEEKDAKVSELQKQLELVVKPGETHDWRTRNLLNGAPALTPFSLGQLAALPEDRPRGDSLGPELFSGAVSVSDGTNTHVGGLSHASSECVDASYRGGSCAGLESVVGLLQSHIRAMEAQLSLTQIDQEELSVVRSRNIHLERMVQDLRSGIEVSRRPWYSGFMNNFCAAPGQRSDMSTLLVDLEAAERSEPSPPAFSGLAEAGRLLDSGGWGAAVPSLVPSVALTPIAGLGGGQPWELTAAGSGKFQDAVAHGEAPSKRGARTGDPP